MNESIIYPGKFFLNPSADTLFCIPKQKLQTLMDREEISNELIQSLFSLNALSDSLLSLKTPEAEGWYNKLLEADTLLEESDLRLAQVNIWQGKERKSGLVWVRLLGWLLAWFCDLMEIIYRTIWV